MKVSILVLISLCVIATNADINVRFDFTFVCNLKDSYEVEVNACEDVGIPKKCSSFTKVQCHGRGQPCRVSSEISDASSEFGFGYEVLADVNHSCSSGRPKLYSRYPLRHKVEIEKGPSNVVLPVSLTLDNYSSY